MKISQLLGFPLYHLSSSPHHVLHENKLNTSPMIGYDRDIVEKQHVNLLDPNKKYRYISFTNSLKSSYISEYDGVNPSIVIFEFKSKSIEQKYNLYEVNWHEGSAHPREEFEFRLITETNTSIDVSQFLHRIHVCNSKDMFDSIVKEHGNKYPKVNIHYYNNLADLQEKRPTI